MSKVNLNSSLSQAYADSYFLSRLEVYNWGAFAGFHEAIIDEAGTAVVGQTGSGKTTLIDALLTLLVQYPKYNFASTGGHESDRSLMSYIRGIAGSGEGLERVARGGKTVTALTAYFSPCQLSEATAVSAQQPAHQSNKTSQNKPNESGKQTAQADLFASIDDTEDLDNQDLDNPVSDGSNGGLKDTSMTDSATLDDSSVSIHTQNHHTIAIGVIFWVDSSSGSASDRKDIWLVSQGHDSTLKDWLTQFADGGSRALKSWARGEDNLTIYDSKSAYLSKVRREFDVSEQAFTLLGRAVGLKQLNSIDEIFRDLVLEDNASFERAEEVIAQFDDLSAIKATLETAKRQHQSLEPLANLDKQWQTKQAKMDALQTMQSALPIWFAHHAKALWSNQVSKLEAKLATLATQREQLREQLASHSDKLNALTDRYREQGGDSIDTLKARLIELDRLIGQCQLHRKQYQRFCQQLVLPPADDEENFASQQAELVALNDKLTAQQAVNQEQINEIGGQKSLLTKQLAELERDLAQAKSQTSNIRPHFEQFRHELAEHLGMTASDLPYVAQLIEVKPSEKAWQGAIERALGSHRLRLLVPKDAMREALAWVNNRDNRLHVRLYSAPSAQSLADAGMPQFFSDGFLRKLNFQSHPLIDALKHLLAGLDRHCVPDAKTLEHTPHAMTQQGLMSNKTGWFDKQDQKRLSEDWLTGFDNQSLLARLQTEISQTQTQLDELIAQQQPLLAEQNNLNAKQIALTQLQTLDFASLDVDKYQRDQQQISEQLAILTAPDSDLAELERQIEQLRQTKQRTDEALRHAEVQYGMADKEQAQAKRKLTSVNRSIDTASPELQSLEAIVFANLSKQLNTVLPASFFTSFDELADEPTAKQANEPIDDHIDELINDLPHLEKTASSHLNEQLNRVQSEKGEVTNKIIRQMERAKREDTGELVDVPTELQDLPTYLARLKFLSDEDLPSKQTRFMAYLGDSSNSSVTQLLTDVSDEVDKINDRIAELNHIMRKVDFEADTYLRLNATPVVHTSLRSLDIAQKRLKAVTLDLTDDDGEAHYQALLAVIGQLQEAVDKKHTLSAKALLDPRHRLTFSVSVMARADDTELESRTGSQGGSGGEKEIIASHILTASLSYALNPNSRPLPKFATIVLDEAFSKSSPQVATRIVDAIREFGLHPLFVTPNKEMRLLRTHTKSAVLVVKKGSQATLSNWSWQQLTEKSAEKLGKL